MAQDIYDHPRKEEQVHREEIMAQGKVETEKGKLQILSKGLATSTLPDLLTTAHFSLLGRSTPFLHFSLRGIPKVWNLQHHRVSSTTQVSCSQFTRWPFQASTRDSPDTLLASVAFLAHGRRFCSLFANVSFWILKPEPYDQCCWVQAPARGEPFE